MDTNKLNNETHPNIQNVVKVASFVLSLFQIYS